MTRRRTVAEHFAQLAQLVAGQCLATIGRLRPAVGWLADQVEPSLAAPVLRRAEPRYMSEAERLRLDGLIRRERRERAPTRRVRPGEWEAGRGLGLATSRGFVGAAAAPARVGILSALAGVRSLVIDAAAAVAASIDVVYVGRSGDDHTMATTALDWLAGVAPPTADVVRAHAWATGLDGWAAIADLELTNPPRWGALDDLADYDTATTVLGLLERADQMARTAAGVPDEVRVPVDAPCPACGRFLLFVEARSQNEREWSIQCGYTWCRCRGGSCGCGRAVTVAGWRHVWPRREWVSLERAMPRRTAGMVLL
jgi:hypothetical protein